MGEMRNAVPRLEKITVVTKVKLRMQNRRKLAICEEESSFIWKDDESRLDAVTAAAKQAIKSPRILFNSVIQVRGCTCFC
jgi:hypothetical protein